jgi:hypothetical protein
MRRALIAAAAMALSAPALACSGNVADLCPGCTAIAVMHVRKGQPCGLMILSGSAVVTGWRIAQKARFGRAGTLPSGPTFGYVGHRLGTDTFAVRVDARDRENKSFVAMIRVNVVITE